MQTNSTGIQTMKARLASLLLVVVAAVGAAAERPLDLRRAWQFRLDPTDEGPAAGWTTNALPYRINLPTTTDLASCI